MNRRTFLQEAARACAGIMAGRATTLAGVRSSGKPLVVDTYSACVELDAVRRGGIDIAIQALTAEEMLVRIPPEPDSAPPPPGVDIWELVFKGPDVIKRILQGVDEQVQEIEREKGKMALALDVREARAVAAGGRLALVMMLKSGWIDEDLAILRTYRRLGIRVMALCHQAAFAWADSTAELKARPGLTDFGRAVVRECEATGILVDLSHASDQTFWDAIRASRKPMIATHSNCRALSRSPRDITDDMIRALAERGGVVALPAWRSRTAAEMTAARLRRDTDLARRFRDTFELAAGQRADAEIWATDLNLEHIDHVVKLAGVDHVGLASHCRSVPQWASFPDALRSHGYGAEEVRKILGENALRVLGQATT